MPVKAVAVCAGVFFCLTAAIGSGASTTRDDRITATVRAVAKVSPAVVNISTERTVTMLHDPFPWFRDFRHSGVGRQIKVRSLGSGVIVEKHGLVITNFHVIRRASRIIVILSNGAKLYAKTIATNKKFDLALLLLVPPEGTHLNLKAIDFAVPNDLFLGEQIITIGNPHGLHNTVSAGILSAVNRRVELKGKTVFDGLIQVDAPINEGNSGGPLVNVNGELVGVNLAIKYNAQGIGFGVPVKNIEDVLSDWLIPSRFGPAIAGLIPGTETDAERRAHAVVRRLIPNSPAASSGLKVGDTILAINDTPVRQAIDISRVLCRMAPGADIRLSLTGDREVSFKVAALKKLSGRELAKKMFRIETQQLTKNLAIALHVHYARGIVITEMAENSPLLRRLRKQDIIRQIGDIPLSNYGDLHRALVDIRKGDTVLFEFDRVEWTAAREVKVERFWRRVTY